MTAAGWGVRSENSETAATNLKEVKIKSECVVPFVPIIPVYRHNRFGCRRFHRGFAGGGYLERW